jgi:hypothetical protein
MSIVKQTSKNVSLPQSESDNLRTLLKSAVDDGDDPQILIASMILTNLLYDKGITEQQFEGNYELYERLCLESNYAVNDQNVNRIYQELTKNK